MISKPEVLVQTGNARKPSDLRLILRNLDYISRYQNIYYPLIDIET